LRRPLLACHDLRIRAAFHDLTKPVASHGLLVNTLVDCNKLVFGTVSALQGVSTASPVAVYASPALFTLLTASLPFGRFAAGATLDTGGWLALTRRGLAPRKIRRASLGTITPPLEGRGPMKRVARMLRGIDR
jgi:hypothetical protein